MHFFSSARGVGRVICHSYLLLAGGLATLGAQTPPSTSGPPVQLDPLIVQGRDSDLVAVAVSASQGIVGARELAARPFLRRGELLEVVPGVIITQHSGGGKANQYFLRGFNLDHGTDFAVSVDGMPVNLRSHAHGQGYADLNFIIPELVRQVDYTKGPFHAEVGDFSSAGAAEFRQFATLPRAFAQLSAGENAFTRVVAGGTRAHASGATTGAIELTRHDGPWATPENAKRYNGFLRHAWSAGAADMRLTAMAYGGRWTATDQIPLRAVESGRLDRFASLDDSVGGESERASVSFDAAWKGSAGSTTLNLHAIYYRLNLFSNFTYFLEDPVNGDQFNQRDRRWVLGGAGRRTWTTTRGETTLGMQARADFVRELGLHRTTRRERIATVRSDRVAEVSAAAFARNQTRWREWLRTEIGARADGFQFDVRSDEPRNSGAARDGIVSPKATVALGPWRKTELYANAGIGFHSNDARGSTIRVDPIDRLTPAERVTPLARSRGAELGLRTAAARGLVSTLAFWALDLDSELVFVGDAGGTEPTGRTRRQGVELSNFWRVTPSLAFDADIALTHARYREDAGGGRRIANSIARVVTFGATWERSVGWFGAARLRHFGPQPLIEDDSARAPSSTTVNARVGWRTKRWEIAVDVLNALDRENHDIAYAYASRLPGEPAGGVDDLHFHPAEPRTARVSVAWTW